MHPSTLAVVCIVTVIVLALAGPWALIGAIPAVTLAVSATEARTRRLVRAAEQARTSNPLNQTGAA